MEDAVSILKRVIQSDPGILRKTWDDAYILFPADTCAEDAASVTALREAWTWGIWPMFLDVRGGSDERRAAWERAAQEMREWSVEEDVIETALPLLARALDWPEDDWRQPQASAEDAAPLEDEMRDAGDRAADAPAPIDWDAQPPAVRSLAALAELLAARRAAGLPELHPPLHLLVRGETESARKAFAQTVATAAARLGFLETDELSEGTTPPETRALWYVRAAALREDRLIAFLDLLAGDACLVLLAGSAKEIAHLLAVCPPLGYGFPQQCTMAEGGGA